jgi:hypothetical protein
MPKNMCFLKLDSDAADGSAHDAMVLKTAARGPYVHVAMVLAGFRLAAGAAG